MAKAIGSRLNRPMVNTSMLRGKAKGKAVASFSKGFALGMSNGRPVRVSCMNCIARAFGLGKGASFGVMLRRSSRVVSRIIVANFKSRGGPSVDNSVISVDGRSLVNAPADGMVRTLRNGVTKTSVVVKSKTMKRSISVLLHNSHSVGNDGTPLFIVSKIRKTGCGRLDPDSVSRVDILGSTSSATVCNSTNTGNIVVVAAGENTTKGVTISLSAGCAVSNKTGFVRNVVNSR